MTNAIELSAPTDAAVITEVARDVRRYENLYTPDPKHPQVHTNILRPGEQVHTAVHEQFYPTPWRQRGTTSVYDVPSFATLLKIEANQGSYIFADPERHRVTAIVNYDGWRDERIVLELRVSERFSHWAAHHGELVGQTEFAQIIEEGIAEIVEPSAADMLELAQTFNATANVDFESGVARASGAVRFRYVERIEASAGAARDLTVPEKFFVRVPVWRSGAVVELRASLRYRVGRSGLLLGYHLDQYDEVFNAAFDVVCAELVTALPAEENAYTLVRGNPPYPINALG